MVLLQKIHPLPHRSLLYVSLSFFTSAYPPGRLNFVFNCDIQFYLCNFFSPRPPLSMHYLQRDSLFICSGIPLFTQFLYLSVLEFLYLHNFSIIRHRTSSIYLSFCPPMNDFADSLLCIFVPPFRVQKKFLYRWSLSSRMTWNCRVSLVPII